MLVVGFVLVEGSYLGSSCRYSADSVEGRGGSCYIYVKITVSACGCLHY